MEPENNDDFPSRRVSLLKKIHLKKKKMVESTKGVILVFKSKKNKNGWFQK